MPMFIVFGLTRPGIELQSIVSVDDALSTQPLIGCLFTYSNTNYLMQINKQIRF